MLEVLSSRERSSIVRGEIAESHPEALGRVDRAILCANLRARLRQTEEVPKAVLAQLS
jgi:hypothetical protein